MNDFLIDKTYLYVAISALPVLCLQYLAISVRTGIGVGRGCVNVLR